MSDHVLVDRLQFTLTVTFHYIFPILTMGLALFVAWLKTVSYKGRESHRFKPFRKTDEEREDYESAARFWAISELQATAPMSDLTRALLTRVGVFAPG